MFCSLILLFFYKKIKVKPAVLLVFARVEALHVHVVTDADSLAEEDNFLFGSETLQWVRDFDINFEFYDFT